MAEIPLTNLTEEEKRENSAAKQLAKQAQKKVIILSDEPKTSNNVLEELDIGFLVSTLKIYIRVNSTVYEGSLAENP